MKKHEPTLCPVCTQEINVSWTERGTFSSDAFERIRCEYCNAGCVLIADVGGKQTRYRCCNCQR